MINFKKPSRIIIVAAIALAAALTIVFAVNRERTPTAMSFTPRRWLDMNDDKLAWDANLSEELPEFPGVTFNWTADEVTAAAAGGEKRLYSGMPVWNVYFADLNGDDLPELCSTVSFGSGIVTTRVVVYDYAGDRLYDLSDYASNDYSLSLVNGHLTVTQVKGPFGENVGEIYGTGTLEIVNGELIAAGIDREKSDFDSYVKIKIPVPEMTE